MPVALVEYKGEQHGFRKVCFSFLGYLFIAERLVFCFFSINAVLILYFVQAENIKFTLEQQMVFFARLIGHFEVADDITPIKIDNFDK